MNDSRSEVPETRLLSVDHQLRLLEKLHQAITERAQREGEVCANYDEQIAMLQREYQDELELMAEQYQQQRAALENEYELVRQQAETQYEADYAATQAEYDRVLATIQSQYEEDVAAAQRKHDESLWLLDSYFDESADDSPKHQYEVFKFQATKAKEHFHTDWEALEQEVEQIRELLRRRRQWRAFRTPRPSQTPTDPGEAQQRFDEAVAAARDSLQKLRRQKLPRLFVGWLPFLLFVGGAGAAGAAAAFLLEPEWLQLPVAKPSPEWFGLCGGAALVVMLVFQLILLAVARSRSGRLYMTLLRHLADAHSSVRFWQAEAKRELSRLKIESQQWDAEVQRRLKEGREKIERRLQEELTRLAEAKESALREANRRFPALLKEITERRDRTIREADETYPRRIARLEQQYESDRQQLQLRHQARLSNHESGFGRDWNELATRWRNALNDALATAEAMNDVSRRFFPDWATLAQHWPVPTELPPGIRIGEFEVDLAQIDKGLPSDERLRPVRSRFTFPAVLPFPENASLVLKAAGAGKDVAVSTLQAAMLRFLTSVPPGRIRFTIIDPVGLGENFSAFMHLADYDELLISNRIWTESSHIEKKLADLTEHMENIFQTYLRNKFKTIQEYNRQAGEVAEPFHVLVIANFPVNFNEAAARRLVSIASSGPRCGIFTLVSVDANQPMPHRFELAELERHATTLVWQQERFVWNRPEFRSLPLRLDPPPEPEPFVAIVRKVGEESKDARRVEVPFDVIAPAKTRMWTSSSRRGLDVPLGRAGATKLQHMRLGRGTSQHVLVAGKTGSGKSSFLHALITNTALHYSPDEVEFYLIDFKKGVEFKTYATHRLPHARVIAIESDREFGLSVLHRVDAILKARGDLFRRHGVQDLPSYREAHPEARLPRILLIIDEFHEFFVEDDKIAADASLLLDRLVRQGRAFGIHVLLGSQTLGGAYSLARSTLGQVAVRIALQCSETDAHLILSEENAAARLLTRPGEAIYNDANGLVEGNHPFQIAWLPEERREYYLAEIQQLTAQRGLQPEPPIVFEGNLPADPAINAELGQLLQAPCWESPPRDPALWLGDPVEIKGPTTVTLRRQSGGNLLIVGQRDAEAAGIMAPAVVSLAAQIPPAAGAEPAPPQFTILDGGSPATSEQDTWRRLADALPHSVRVADPRQSAACVADLAKELTRRNEQSDQEEPPLFLLVFNL
ncbi:MAG TPA: cell division protein FtsK, partial [Planctomycetaceae bacterium]|nr:cell division protein FtsK [Planctomycetaceae bacterium]